MITGVAFKSDLFVIYFALDNEAVKTERLVDRFAEASMSFLFPEGALGCGSLEVGGRSKAKSGQRKAESECSKVNDIKERLQRPREARRVTREHTRTKYYMSW